MTAQDVYKRLMHFIDNDFTHHCDQQVEDMRILRRNSIWTFITIIAGMLGIIGTLIALVLK